MQLKLSSKHTCNPIFQITASVLTFGFQLLPSSFLSCATESDTQLKIKIAILEWPGNIFKVECISLPGKKPIFLAQHFMWSMFVINYDVTCFKYAK